MARAIILLILLSSLDLYAATVTIRRVPDNGLEPQVAVDSKNIVHLIYFTGEDKAGDVMYRTSSDAAATWSEPHRVNSTANSAMIVGAVRGPQLAVDANNRPHVIWTGNDAAQPKPRVIGLPLLYSRLDGEAFTPQRNIPVGIDGGASIAADRLGNVCIVLHGSSKPDGDEQSRRLFMFTSKDNFANPAMLHRPEVGACACCAVHAFFDDAGQLQVIFRAADKLVHRDMYLNDRKLGEWNIGKCVMSTADAAGDFIAWESQDKVMVSNLAGSKSATVGSKNPKHPRLAISRDHVLVAWTENTAWHKGGSVHWQLLDHDLKPLAGLASSGQANDLPAWDYPATFATPDGSFVILY